MKKINKFWFTLVELIVSVSISAILMIWVSLFVSDWVKNITNQKVNLENNEDFTKFKYFFWDTMNSQVSYATWFTTNSWVLFRSEKNYYRWWFTYIWEKFFTGIYCSWTENDSTKHIIIKNFIPFESVIWNWDIFTWKNYSDWTYSSSYFSWTIQNAWNSFSWTYFWPSDIVFWNWNDMYVSDTINHTILKFDKNNTSLSGQIIAWISWNFWNNFVSWANPTRVNLNNPTWLAFWDNVLFIADTLNDRILYISASWLIYELLNRDDSIREPTWIYYDSSTKTLYISNSWSREILSYFWWSDSNVFTKPDNTLKVITWSLSYPTWIKFDWTNIIYSDFLERKIKTISLAWNQISSTNLQNFDFSKIVYNKYSDYLLYTPIKSFNYNYYSNLFSLNLEYYKLYSCIDSKSNISRTYLFKKYIK